MKILSIISFFLFFFNSNTLLGQTQDIAWIKALADKVLNETDLCERCTWVRPAISEVEFNNRLFYFLRYGCSTSESVAEMYEPDGTYLGRCMSNNNDFACNPSDVDAFITYTFASKITVLWSCEIGYTCAFAETNNIDLEVPIFVDDTRCSEGIKTLTVSDKFATYQWEGVNVFGTSPTLEIIQGGTYSVTVTDEDNCTYIGEIDIPDINKIDVIIKGPSQICPNTEVELKSIGFQSYQWSNGSTDLVTTVMEAGTYQLTVTNSQNCEGIANFLISSFDTPSIKIEADLPKVQEGNPVNVSVIASGTNGAFVSYEWRANGILSCYDCPTTEYYPQLDNQLSVLVVDENGCSSTTNFSILVEALPLEVFVPNVFRPKSLVGNEKFTVFGGTNIQVIETFSVFDRWGNLVFNKEQFLPNDTQIGWDGRFNGKFVDQNIYLFQAIVLFVNNERKVFSGDVLLLR